MTANINSLERNETILRKLPERRYRPEIHGVRGLALLGVVLFHLFGSGRVSGGIDIFLAVSGFLFTGMLLREAASSGGKIDFLRYFGRLIRRIVVPAAIVVTTTLAIGLIVLPSTEHRQLWSEARASLFYFENFELISSHLSYNAASSGTSPFQHFWSLSVQGQFYLIWPIVAIAAVILARLLKKSAANIMLIFVSVIVLVSFFYAQYVGTFNQDESYLMTSTRLWELGFGGLLALLAGNMVLSPKLRNTVGWFGIALIISCGFVLDGAELFPGPWALWPLMGFAMVIVASNGVEAEGKWSAARFLSNKPLFWIGDHAYGIYLWHWPVLIFYLEIRNRTEIGFRGALFVLLVTLLLAVVTYRLVESPLKRIQQNREPIIARKANRIVLIGAVVVAIVSAGLAHTQTGQVASYERPWDENFNQREYPGASAQLLGLETNPNGDFFPAVEDAFENHRPEYVFWDCEQKMGDDPGTDEVRVCEDKNAPQEPTATIALAGGSHAGHWQKAFENLASEENWELLIVTKSSCIFRDIADPENDMCASWQINFMDWLEESDVDLVVTPGTRMDPEGGPEYIHPDAPDRWREILATDTDLLLLRGTPRHDRRIPECIAEGNAPTECGPSTSQIAEKNPLDNIDLDEGIFSIDLNEYICPAAFDKSSERCSGVVGNVLIWYDRLHFTDVFSDSLTLPLEKHLSEEISWLFQ